MNILRQAAGKAIVVSKLLGVRGGKRRSKGIGYKVVPRLRECCRQVEAEVVSNSRNRIHQTWGLPFS